MTTSSGWFFWAALSAVFAALTAIFAKIGIQGVDSDLATLVRTVVIVFVLAAFVGFAGKWSNPLALSGRTWFSWRCPPSRRARHGCAVSGLSSLAMPHRQLQSTGSVWSLSPSSPSPSSVSVRHSESGKDDRGDLRGRDTAAERVASRRSARDDRPPRGCRHHPRPRLRSGNHGVLRAVGVPTGPLSRARHALVHESARRRLRNDARPGVEPHGQPEGLGRHRSPGQAVSSGADHVGPPRRDDFHARAAARRRHPGR